MRRRTLLFAASSTLAALAGCSTGETDEQTPTGTTPDAGETSTGTTPDARETPTGTSRPSASDALVVESTYAIEGTMVVPGVGGTVRNTGDADLVSCTVEAAATVGGERYTGEIQRSNLEAGATWEWEVNYEGAEGDTVEDIEITTRAAYPQ
jgi:hypothetical protein